jgi:hypothetical protein
VKTPALNSRQEETMTEEQAKRLAALFKGYRARKLRGQWLVWCDASDHVVEFDQDIIEQAAQSIHEHEEHSKR